MPHSSALRSRLRIGAFALLATSALGCNEPKAARQAAPATPAPAAEAPAVPAASPPSAANDGSPPAAEEKPYYQGPGWSELKIQDSLPLCVFGSGDERDKAPFIEQVSKQTLTANAPVVFGVFPPWCLNSACDAMPALQCWVERDGDTLTVHTRFFSFHNAGAKCESDCLDVDTACETPELPPGIYTIRHGEKTYKLKIPSSPRSPCFKAK